MSIRIGSHPYSQAVLKKIQSKIKLRRRISVNNEILQGIENGHFKLSIQAQHAFSKLVDISSGDYANIVDYIYTMEWSREACEHLYAMYIRILPLLNIWENQNNIPFVTNNMTGENVVIITVKRFNKNFSDVCSSYQFQDSGNMFHVKLNTSMSEIRSINKLNKVLPVRDLKALLSNYEFMRRCMLPVPKRNFHDTQETVGSPRTPRYI